jgi:hypothetical protein
MGAGFFSSPKYLVPRRLIANLQYLRRFAAFCGILWHFAAFCGKLAMTASAPQKNDRNKSQQHRVTKPQTTIIFLPLALSLTPSLGTT